PGPHRQVPRREVDPADIAELGEPTKPGIALRDRFLHLLGGEPGTDDGGRDRDPCIAGEIGWFAKDRAGLRRRAAPERLQLLLREPIEVLLGGEGVRRRTGEALRDALRRGA